MLAAATQRTILSQQSLLCRLQFLPILVPLSRILNLGAIAKLFVTCPSIVCITDDNAPFPEYLAERDCNDMSMGASLEIRYSSWAVQMMNGIVNKDVRQSKETLVDHQGMGKEEIMEEVAESTMMDDNLDFEFFQTGLGLFGQLTVAAMHLKAEWCLVNREGSPAGIVALFAASMALIFTATLYHT
ncbi:unnamed protein product [Sphagnum jensenii]|uniref:Uncharacterized protein n=1 Tax=Sphagnum jensenii TaxID=128206 RepID=A0ABP1B0G1_9BRYO